MSSAIEAPRFFGLDLHALQRELRAAWQQIQGWLVSAWLTPTVPVRLLRSTGEEQLWLVDITRAHPSGDKVVPSARFVAVELPEDDLLIRAITLPKLPAAELSQAVAIEVAGASPFPPEDLVWGYSTRPVAQDKLEVQIALASRKRISSYLEGIASRVPGQSSREVWAVPGQSAPIIFSGFGEQQRRTHAQARQRIAFGLVLLSLGLAICVALTPVAQARLRAMEAIQASETLAKRAEPLVRQRAALLRNVEKANSIKEITAQRADPLYVMDLLTRVLPDDTSLLSLQVQGSKIAINGSTSDAAALMQQLSAQPELRDVKAPTPATRPLGTTKDSFSIEFNLAPRPGGVKAAGSPGAPALAPALAAAAPAAPQLAASAAAPQSAAPATAATASPAAAPTTTPPATQYGASFGGATFGAPAVPAKKAP
jgi:general secretion pathway protein L